VAQQRQMAPGAAQRYLWAEMQQTGSLGTLTSTLARQPDRPPRPVTLSITAKLVTFQGARRPGGKLPPVTVSAVYAQELSPPEGEAPVEWLLLRSLPVTDFPQACTVVQWYRCRWEIELFQSQDIKFSRAYFFVTVQVVKVILRRGGLLQPHCDKGGAMGQACPCTPPGTPRSYRQGHGDAAA
jgi:hypothetical protein